MQPVNHQRINLLAVLARKARAAPPPAVMGSLLRIACVLMSA